MKQAKVLDQADIKRIKAVINDNRYAVRNLTMFVLAINVGLRAKEIASIKVKDVMNSDSTLRSECVLTKDQVKNGEANRVFLNSNVQKQLRKYFDKHAQLKNSPESTLFVSKNNNAFTPHTVVDMFRRVFELANIQGASSHSMRRTFATTLAENVVSVFAIQKLMRHKNLATTQLYVSVTDNQLAKATNNLGF